MSDRSTVCKLRKSKAIRNRFKVYIYNTLRWKQPNWTFHIDVFTKDDNNICIVCSTPNVSTRWFNSALCLTNNTEKSDGCRRNGMRNYSSIRADGTRRPKREKLCGVYSVSAACELYVQFGNQCKALLHVYEHNWYSSQYIDDVFGNCHVPSHVVSCWVSI